MRSKLSNLKYDWAFALHDVACDALKQNPRRAPSGIGGLSTSIWVRWHPFLVGFKGPQECFEPFCGSLQKDTHICWVQWDCTRSCDRRTPRRGLLSARDHPRVDRVARPFFVW